MSEVDNFALPEENKVPYVAEEFPQLDPNAVENELIDQFKDMQANMPAQDVAAHFFQMYNPIYKQLVDGLSNKDLRRLAWHIIQWPLVDADPKFHEERATQAFSVAIRLRDCYMIMKNYSELERHQEILNQKAKAEAEDAAKAAEQSGTPEVPQTQGEANGEQV